MLSPLQIRQSNARTWRAVAAVRITSDPATRCELFDALNSRRRARNARLTEAAKTRLRRAFELSPAGH
jgi:hypothetical protein